MSTVYEQAARLNELLGMMEERFKDWSVCASIPLGDGTLSFEKAGGWHLMYTNAEGQASPLANVSLRIRIEAAAEMRALIKALVLAEGSQIARLESVNNSLVVLMAELDAEEAG